MIEDHPEEALRLLDTVCERSLVHTDPVQAAVTNCGGCPWTAGPPRRRGTGSAGCHRRCTGAAQHVTALRPPSP
ncbi:hypothetical protein SAURM35S_03609 [Streptomyces aurantiogriseus]